MTPRKTSQPEPAAPKQPAAKKPPTAKQQPAAQPAVEQPKAPRFETTLDKAIAFERIKTAWREANPEATKQQRKEFNVAIWPRMTPENVEELIAEVSAPPTTKKRAPRK